MERATIYRTISGPTALFGAILAIATSLFLPSYFATQSNPSFKPSNLPTFDPFPLCVLCVLCGKKKKFEP